LLPQSLPETIRQSDIFIKAFKFSLQIEEGFPQ
jgi:hypothetical protein